MNSRKGGYPPSDPDCTQTESVGALHEAPVQQDLEFCILSGESAAHPIAHKHFCFHIDRTPPAFCPAGADALGCPQIPDGLKENRMGGYHPPA